MFSTSFSRNGSGFVRIANFCTPYCADTSLGMSFCSLSVVDGRELIEVELECRLERMFERQIRKLGLFECGIVDNDGLDEEEEEEEDNAGDRGRVDRVVIVDDWKK